MLHPDFKRDLDQEFYLLHNECLESLQQLGNNELTSNQRHQKIQDVEANVDQIKAFIASTGY